MDDQLYLPKTWFQLLKRIKLVNIYVLEMFSKTFSQIYCNFKIKSGRFSK